MRLFLAALLAALFASVGLAQPQPDKAFPRGLKGPSPAAAVAAAPKFTPKKGAPDQFAMVPPKISMWGNSTYGCCVTTEAAFAKAAWSVYCGLPETFVPDSEVIRWANAHGVLNGAYLTEVLDWMRTDGFRVNGQEYRSGPYSSVNYRNADTLKAALTVGPVDIAIDADALPSGAGNRMGWFKLGSNNPRTDHCVSLCGYGPASFLFQQINTPLPAGLPGTTEGYLLFTWNTIGFVDQAWINGTCAEAYVRDPTTPGQSPQVTPPAITTFTATPQAVLVGESSTLAWATTGATAVTLNGATVPLTGSQLVTPATTTVYTLTATGGGGTTSKAVTVTLGVTPPPMVGWSGTITYVNGVVVSVVPAAAKVAAPKKMAATTTATAPAVVLTRPYAPTSQTRSVTRSSAFTVSRPALHRPYLFSRLTLGGCP